MDPLASFTCRTFRDRVGERFALADGLDLELVDVTDHASTNGSGQEGGRTPFSLLFRGPLDPWFSQGLQEVSHPELGDFALFLVPVARLADGMRYEAVFS